MEKKKLINWIKSIVINLIIVIAVLSLTNMMYETNDDYAIAARIVKGYPEIEFINYYLCLAASKLQQFTPDVNVFVIGQIVLSFISFTLFLKIILDRGSGVVIPAAISVIAILSFEHYCSIQFTKTSAIVIFVALLAMTDALINADRSNAFIIVTALLLIAGAGLRNDGLIVGIAFSLLYIGKWIFENRGKGTEGVTGKRIVAALLIVLSVSICYGSRYLSSQQIVRTTELERFSQYNYARADVTDYGVLGAYNEKKNEYEKIGISENDVFLIKKWFLDYDGAADLDNLKAIAQIGGRTKHITKDGMSSVKSFLKATKQDIKKLNNQGVHIIILIILGLWLIIAGRKERKLFAIAIGILTAALHIYLYYIGRPAYRAMYVMDAGAALWIMYDISEEGGGKRARVLVPGIVLILTSIIMLYPIYTNVQKSFEGVKSRAMSQELVDYLDQHENSFYVVATQEKKSEPNYLKPWKAPNTEVDKNYIGTGSWGTLSPYVLDKTRRYGIENPIKELIGNDIAHYMGNKNIDKVTEYYNKWYGNEGKRIKLIQVDEIGGIKIWQVAYSE